MVDDTDEVRLYDGGGGPDDAVTGAVDTVWDWGCCSVCDFDWSDDRKDDVVDDNCADIDDAVDVNDVLFFLPKKELTESLAVFLLDLTVKSYISPNIPANVLRKFFIVSSVSSMIDDCVWGPRADGLLAADAPALVMLLVEPNKGGSGIQSVVCSTLDWIV